MVVIEKGVWNPMFSFKVIIEEFSDIGSMFWNHHMTPAELHRKLNKRWKWGDIDIHMDENDIVLHMLFIAPDLDNTKQKATLVLKMMVDILEEES